VTLAVASLALVGLVALSLLRYEQAVALGIVVLAVGRPEPSPADAIFAVVIAVAIITGRLDLRRAPRLLVGLVGLFIALNLLTAIGAVDFGVVPRFFAVTLYLCVFAIWLCGYVRTPHRAQTLVRAYVLGAVVSAALASLALFVHFPGHESLLIFGDRARGFYKDANVFGPFLVPAALILMEELVTPRLLTSRRPVKGVLLAILLFGILFSFSRASWLNLAFGTLVTMAVVALRPDGARKAMAWLAMIVVLAVPVVAVMAATGTERFFQERTHLQTYDTQRFGTQSAGIRLAERHFLGVGPAQFEVIETRSAHSTYIRALVEQGVAGFVVLGLIFGSTLVLAARNTALGRDTYGIGSAALLGSWCGILLNSAVVDTLHWRHLWLVAALIWAGAMRYRVVSPRAGEVRAVPAARPTATAAPRRSRGSWEAPRAFTG
jgi:O-antigen ligase